MATKIVINVAQVWFGVPQIGTLALGKRNVPIKARRMQVMAVRGFTSLLCSTALAVCFAMPAIAEDKRAVVIAGSEAQRDRAVAMSEALLGLGFDVRRLEAPDSDLVADAIAGLDASSGPTAVYYAGEGAALADYVGDAVSAPRFVFLDACVTGDLSDAPANVFVATTDAECTMGLSDVLLDRLTVPGLTTDQWDLADEYRAVSTLTDPYVFRTASSDVRLTADDYAMLETLSPAARDRMIQLWRDAGIPVDATGGTVAPVTAAPQTVRVSPVRPVAPTAAAVVRPIAPRVTGSTTGTVSVLARPTVSPTPTTTALANGLPQPSILVGYVIENLPDAPQVPNEPLAGNAFGIDDVTAREALRAQDAALFGGLVAQGAFDPPEEQIARALQVELARINCYTSGIDGDWGPGSQRALLAFYEEIGEVPPGSAAELESFRQVIARDDIRCPEIVPVQVAQPVAPAAPRSAASAQSQRSAPAPARVAPAQPAAPAPAPAAAPAQTNRRSISQTGGTGVFR